MNNGKACLSLSFLLLLPAMSPAIAQITSVDRFVPHVSTVPANEGAQVGLYLHEKIDAALQTQIAAGASPQGKVVLFIHGVSVTSAPAFDLPYKDYSWMEFLASQGFDTFSMDHQGYGYSPQPHMDNPCNLSAEDQASIDAAATANCRADYQRQLTSSQTDWDEIDSVVDYLRELRGVDKVSIIGWSLGGIRTGGYAANHGEKLDKLVLFAPVYRQGSAATAPSNFPVEAAPLSLQTKDTLLNNRWGSNVACENQVEEGIAEVAWQAIMSYDRFGSSWNKPDGVMRVRSASYWGWDEEAAAKISNPTLILIGEQDGLLLGAASLYGDRSGIRNKAIIRMECATHFAVWEASQYKFMQEASLEWLNEGTYRGNSIGEFKVAYGGMNLD